MRTIRCALMTFVVASVGLLVGPVPDTARAADDELPPIRVQGTVADESGRPVEGATVYVGDTTPPFDERTTTAADGTFRLRFTGRNPHVVVDAPGRPLVQTYLGTATGPARPRVEIRLPAGRTVRGRVIRAKDGAPVAAAQVTAWQVEASTGQTKSWSGTSGDDGGFRLDGLPREPVRVRVRIGDSVGSAEAADGAGDCEVRIAPARSLVGRAVGTGKSGGARIGLWSRGVLLDEAVTSEDGSFRLAAESFDGTHLVGTGPGLARIVQPVEAAADGSVAPGEVSLAFAPARDLAVRVVREGGTPWEGASVRIGDGWKAPPPAWTDAAGTARFENVPRAPVRVEVVAAGFLPVRVDADPDAAAVQATLVRARSVTGRVVDADGEPAALCDVEVRRAAEERASGHGATRLDGTFEVLDLAPGACEVVVQRPEVPQTEDRKVRVPAEAGGAAVTVTLPAAAADAAEGELLLRVRDADGRPMPRFSVSCSNLRRMGGRFSDTWGRRGSAVIRAAPPPDGRTVIWVSQALGAAGSRYEPLGLAPVRVEFTKLPDGPLDVTLAAAPPLTGRVALADPAALDSAEVAAFPLPQDAEDGSECMPLASLPLAADGAFSFAGLGTTDVTVRLNLLGPYHDLAPAPLLVRAGSPPVTIGTPKAVEPVIRVVGPRGAPVVGCQVLARPLVRATAPDYVDGGTRAATTDADGAARLPAVDALADYALRVIEDSGGAREIRPWRPADTEVSLDPALLAMARVIAGTDADERTLPFAAVECARPDGTWATVASDESGLVRVWTSEPGAKARLRAPGGEVVEAVAGADPVALRVPPETFVILCGGPSLADAGAPIHVRPEPAVGEPQGLPGWSERAVTGMVPGRRFRIVVGPTDAGWAVVRGGIPGGQIIDLEFTQGRNVSGRVVDPDSPGRVKAGTRVTAWCFGSLVGSCDVQSSGAFILRRLPSAHMCVSVVEGETETVTVDLEEGDVAGVVVTIPR